MQRNDRYWHRAIVVGASSGIGEAIARQLGVRGVRVALVARRLSRLEEVVRDIHSVTGQDGCFALEHDVRNQAEVATVFQEAATRLGGLDLVVYATGVMPRIEDNSYPTEIDKTIIETNLIGAVAWLNAAADRFTRAGTGTIVGISSEAGERGRRANPVYGASKAGLNAYLASLQARLSRYGVKVVIAKPGYVRTDLLDGVQLPPFPPAIGPERAADEILRAAAAGKRVVHVPGFWRYRDADRACHSGTYLRATEYLKNRRQEPPVIIQVRMGSL